MIGKVLKNDKPIKIMDGFSDKLNRLQLDLATLQNERKSNSSKELGTICSPGGSVCRQSLSKNSKVEPKNKQSHKGLKSRKFSSLLNEDELRGGQAEIPDERAASQNNSFSSNSSVSSSEENDEE